jgi:hypothetical protein
MLNKIYMRGGFTLRGKPLYKNHHHGNHVQKSVRCLLHPNEFVLPKGVEPTKKQIKQVKIRHGTYRRKKAVHC